MDTGDRRDEIVDRLADQIRSVLRTGTHYTVLTRVWWELIPVVGRAGYRFDILIVEGRAEVRADAGETWLVRPVP